jgi:hypothetical protein
LDSGQLGMLSGRIDRAINGLRLRRVFMWAVMIMVCRLFVA